MAVCKRCGATFNYEKHEGICPKFCYYNRDREEDQRWLERYNYRMDTFGKSYQSSEEDGEKYDSLLGYRKRKYVHPEPNKSRHHMAKPNQPTRTSMRNPQNTGRQVSGRQSKKGHFGKGGCFTFALIAFFAITWIYEIIKTMIH